MDKISEAIKRLENFEVKVVFRGGKIVMIPAQRIELQERNGIQDIKIIHADIVNEEQTG